MQTKTIKLGLKQRFFLEPIIPTEGMTRVTSILVRDFKNKIEYSLEEIEKYEIKDILLEGKKQGVTWNVLGNSEVATIEIEIPNEVLELILFNLEKIGETTNYSVNLLELEELLKS